jgi:2-phosphosulfolactate phosphatase
MGTALRGVNLATPRFFPYSCKSVLTMTISLLHCLEGARSARGLTVVIDVFRAFSVACYAFGNGASTILPQGELAMALALKRRNPDCVLMGERGGQMPAGFDFGNSPAAIEGVDFSGKTIVQATSAGTRGIVSASAAEEIITGSFVNAGAIVRYIRQRNPAQLSLVAMGWAGERIADEDTLCASYIWHCLEEGGSDFTPIREFLLGCGRLDYFFDPAQEWAPARDFELCLALDAFDFVIRAERDEQGGVVLHKVALSQDGGFSGGNAQ